jgi:hypothetical protein
MEDEFINVRWPADNDRRDTLSEMLDGCFRGHLSCDRLADCLLRQDDERLSTIIVVLHRQAKISLDMLKTLWDWDSHYPEEMRAAVEGFVRNIEFATLELRKQLPECTPEAHAEGRLPATEVAIRRELAVIVDGLSSGIEFARVWFGINL